MLEITVWIPPALASYANLNKFLLPGPFSVCKVLLILQFAQQRWCVGVIALLDDSFSSKHTVWPHSHGGHSWFVDVSLIKFTINRRLSVFAMTSLLSWGSGDDVIVFEADIECVRVLCGLRFDCLKVHNSVICSLSSFLFLAFVRPPLAQFGLWAIRFWFLSLATVLPFLNPMSVVTDELEKKSFGPCNCKR